MTDAPETCDVCGFDAAEWNELDTRRTIAAAPILIGLWTAGMVDDDRNTRPEPHTWSVNEYVDHLRETLFGLRALAEIALESPGLDLGAAIEPGPPGTPRRLVTGPTVDGFTSEAEAFTTLLSRLSTDQWQTGVVFGGNHRSVEWASRHAVHDFWHHLIDIAAIRRSLGDPSPAQTGSVEQINVSSGGVPKRRIGDATVGRRGVEGDRQAARQHHGRPWQALCLWSADVIDELRAAGHPIEAGNAGENLTLRDIDWGTLRAGTILEIGDVRCQLSAPAVPCAKNNQWFADGDSQRIHHDRRPERTRWYASVPETGSIAAGADVAVVG